MLGNGLLYILLLILPMLSMPLSFEDSLPSPRQQQMAFGMPSSSVVCSDGLILIQEISTSNVDCVKSQTADKLVNHNWAKILPSTNVQKIIFVSTDADPSSISYHPSIIKSIKKMISDCTRSTISLGYGLGGESISLNKINNLCDVSISGDIEMGEFGYHCSVALEKMKNWTSWQYDVTVHYSSPFYTDSCKKTK